MFAFDFFQQQDGAGAGRGDLEPPPPAPAGPGTAEEVTTSCAASAGATPASFDHVQLPAGIHLLKGHVSSQQASALLGEAGLCDSDLLPGRYEGGFKLWEGAIDLCQFLCSQYELTAELLQAAQGPLLGRRVLELGCGHGIPAILCLLAGATAHFQDYNREVLTSLTMPNVAANLQQLPGSCQRPASRFWAGEWRAVAQQLQGEQLAGSYDIVLSAETIYNADSQEALLSCIKQVLKPPDGVAFIAAKSFYFGVGGGTAAFAQRVQQDGTLVCRQVWKVEDGASNKREILELRFADPTCPAGQ